MTGTTMSSMPSSEASTTFQLSGKGVIYAFTTVIDAPEGFAEQAPYMLAIIRLDEGPMLTAQLTDLGDTQPQPGMRVEMVTRKLRSEGTQGVIAYGYKFRPVLE